MDYGRPDRCDRLAAEYVLGTLRGPARRRFENLLPAHPALRRAVARWQTRLAPLGAALAPVAPPADLWRRLQTRLFGSAAPQRGPSLAWWRGATALTALAALTLSLRLLWPQAAEPPLLVVLETRGGAPAQGRFVASVAEGGAVLVLRPIDAPAPVAGRAFELWSLPATGAPRSLGLVATDGPTTLRRADLVRDAAALAVSVEPAGGSPTGAPTGPVIALGRLRS